jgi:NTP pyrophosphatase (non-canonical NTP hydrolase)
LNSLNDYSSWCHQASLQAGWWPLEVADNPMVVAQKIALIHSEISEALEGDRKNSQDDKLPHRKAIEVELADALIRIFDLAGFLDLDLEGAVSEKMAYNKTRADHKKENREAAGGKKY